MTTETLSAGRQILETERLRLREFVTADAPFVLELLLSPGWLQFIGDRGVRTVEAAATYLEERLLSSYRINGYGLYLVELKDGGRKAGMCGLVKRAGLEDTDIGFALMPRFQGAGYGREAARSVLNYAQGPLGLSRILAITAQDNVRSVRLLQDLGFRHEGLVRLPGDEEVLLLLACSGAD